MELLKKVLNGSSAIWVIQFKRLGYINEIVGDDMKINCGVPIGSILDSVLFIMYINSICNMQRDNNYLYW